MADRKEVNRRLVDSKVIGSANPVAKWGRDSKKTCFDTIGGFFFGLLLFIVPFFLVFNAAKTEKDSKDISKLTPVSVSSVSDLNGRQLVEGTVTPGAVMLPPITDTKDILAYRYVKEKYEMHIETRTETETVVENGQEVQRTYEVEEEVWDWETKEEDEKWATVNFGSMTIDPSEARVMIDWEETHSKEWEENGEKWREKEEVKKGNRPALLAAEFVDGSIKDDPDFFILSVGSKEDLVSQLNFEEEGKRRGLLIFSIILMAVSFNLMLGPALLLINIFPVKQLGGAARFAVGCASLVLSVAIVAATYMFFRFWWVIILLLAGLAVWVVIDANKNRSDDPNMDLPDEPDMPAAQGTT